MPDLKQTIQEDINYYINLIDPEKFYNYMYLNTCTNSEKSGLYQLIFNGIELWYGTLPEINAIIKTMIRLKEKAADYGI